MKKIYINHNNNLEPLLESLSENFSLDKEDVIKSTCFKTITRFQQKDKSLIETISWGR